MSVISGHEKLFTWVVIWVFFEIQAELSCEMSQM